MQRRRWVAPVLLALSLPLLVPLIANASPDGASSGDSPSARSAPADLAATAQAPLEEVSASATQVASGLRRPTAIVAPDDGTGRLFITQKSGSVRVYHPDTGLSDDLLLDITEHVDETGNERGLLGIALAPDFADSQQMYLAYTALPDSAVTLARYSLADDSLEVLLQQEHAEYSNHNGGQLAFGPDGNLYWSVGDGGGSGDPFSSGQRLDTLLGKIVRVDVSASCGDLPYCIPEDNPFVGVEGARAEIWNYGLRNPWRFSIDPADGSLWIGDVGQGTSEEINHLAPAEQPGANLGWSCREGEGTLNEDQCDADATYTEPVFTYPLTDGNCAVIGGRVYHGEQFADLVGDTYIATDYCSSRIWALREDGQGGYLQAELGEFPTQVTAIGETAEGEFYVVNDLPGGLHQVTFERVEPLCRVDVTTQAWGGGQTVDLTVTNTGSETIDGWTLTFPLPTGQSIVSDWNTTLFERGGVITATDSGHNAVIEPGESVSLGYLVEHGGAGGTPTSFALNKHSCAVG